MDADHFDDVTRSLTKVPSRRAILAGCAATALGLTMPAVGDAEKGRKRKKKVKRNEFGCVNVGGKCRGKDANCCSGICRGKKGKRRCVAHDAGNCQPGQNASVGLDVGCSRGGDEAGAVCFTTTGNAPYCMSGNDLGIPLHEGR